MVAAVVKVCRTTTVFVATNTCKDCTYGRDRSNRRTIGTSVAQHTPCTCKTVLNNNGDAADPRDASSSLSEGSLVVVAGRNGEEESESDEDEEESSVAKVEEVEERAEASQSPLPPSMT